MLGKLLLPFQTSRALKNNDAIRISECYSRAQKIGILLTYNGEEDKILVDTLMDNIERDGKEITLLIYVPKVEKGKAFNYPNFTVKDLEYSGNFENKKLEDFVNTPFDYLLNLDIEGNDAIEYVLASSKAKCRVGNYKEHKEEFYELMIDSKGESYEAFLVQVYHYIKNVRNG